MSTEATWLLDPRWDDVPAATPAALARVLDLAAGGRVILLAPHPDDETLGLGGTLAELSTLGLSVTIVLLTDGGASHPRCRHIPRAELVERRAAEFAEAVAALAPRATVVSLGLPDGGLPAATERLRASLSTLVEPGDVLLAPLPDDGHTDHDATGLVAGQVAAQREARLLNYPIWRWLTSTPDSFPFERAVLLTPSAASLHSKEQAIRGYRSQSGPLTAFPGGEAILGSVDLAPHRRVVETLVTPQGAPTLCLPGSDAGDEAPVSARLSAMFDGGDDPWHTRSSWYEKRKRDLCLAALARRRYRRILDIGCSVGTLAAELAGRADEVVAVDSTPEAIAHARRRYASLQHVRWILADVPADLPDDSFDLVVLSEVGYFLTGAQLLGTLRHARRCLSPGGEILLCDWTHPTTAIPLDGELVHRQAATALGLEPRVTVVDPDFRIDVYGGPATLVGQ
ncbi:MAG: PIG-L family deacetylase [Micrococcales bacterium]|nr:PIG-L family deacetylase [Micrococcales bacterium]